MERELTNLEKKFEEELRIASSERRIDTLHLKYLGKRGKINKLLKDLPNLSIEERKIIGPKINSLKNKIKQRLNIKRQEIKKEKENQWIDYTIPGLQIETGHLHPTTIVIRELNNFFRYQGYSVAEGPEIETDDYTFEKLNLPKDHPARDLWDTLYINEPEVLLRTHTSSVETRTMTKHKPPIRVVVPGKCYRNETTNSSNNAVFYQYEGLAIDKGINMAHLKYTLESMSKFLYGKDIKSRFRCKYYPQVEPGAGLDIMCTFCQGKGCQICKYRGWIELLGAGMVHPNVLEQCGINHKIYSGFAFGIGLDRIVMTKFNIKDIRHLYGGVLVYLR